MKSRYNCFELQEVSQKAVCDYKFFQVCSHILVNRMPLQGIGCFIVAEQMCFLYLTADRVGVSSQSFVGLQSMSIIPRFYAFSFLQLIGLNVNFVHRC